MRRLLSTTIATLFTLGLCTPVHAASSEKLKIGGNGPIDRPTAHTGGWCYATWRLCAAPLDSFVADGDSATVVVRARNWRTGDPTRAIEFHLDNVVVVERSVHDAHYYDIGDPEPGGFYNCDLAFTGRDALDFAAIRGEGTVYFSDFDGAIGPEWSYDPAQVSYQVGTSLNIPMYDDPFDPAPSTTGSMRIGSGAGPEFVEATLQLSGLTPGTEYVFSYWSASFNDDTFPPCSSPEFADDYEIAIYGETELCLPDLPLLGVNDVRTLDWDPQTMIWRFQPRFETDGAGEAFEATATIIQTSTGIEVLEDEVPVAYFGTAESRLTPWAGGSYLVDLSQHQDPFLVLSIRYDYTNDCGGMSEQERVTILSNPESYPTANPPFVSRLALGPNVPNPFNPRTILPVTMPAEGQATLTIFDLSGRRIRMLHQGFLPAGAHDFEWDARDATGRTVASGVYLAHLRSGGAVASQRMLLLK